MAKMCWYNLKVQYIKCINAFSEKGIKQDGQSAMVPHVCLYLEKSNTKCLRLFLCLCVSWSTGSH